MPKSCHNIMLEMQEKEQGEIMLPRASRSAFCT